MPIIAVQVVAAMNAVDAPSSDAASRSAPWWHGGEIGRVVERRSPVRRFGIHGLQRFARAWRHDIEAVRNAVLETWSNAQTAGQINRVKTLKRAMYGRAGVDLLRARLTPLHTKFCTKSETEPSKRQHDNGNHASQSTKWRRRFSKAWVGGRGSMH